MNQHWLHLLVAGVVGVVVGVVAYRTLPTNAADTNLEWQFPGGSLKMDVKKDLSDPEVMFSRLFKTDFSREGTLGLLRNKQIFALTDEKLVEGLSQSCPDTEGSTESPEQRQQRLEKCLHIPVVKRLRELAAVHQPPFQYIGKMIQVGIPAAAENKPAEGHANVCRNKGMLGYPIQLLNPTNNRQLRVEATGSYLCTDYGSYPELQLSEVDAAKLFKRPTMKTETLIAVVVYE